MDYFNEIRETTNAAFKEGDTTKVFLGFLVAILPKLIPRLMPHFMADARIQEKFRDEAYLEQIEDLFRQKFLANLEVFERIVLAWKNDALSYEDFGLTQDHVLARDDFIAGDPAPFQSDLLAGIDFLKHRMAIIDDDQDPINSLANAIWSTATTASSLIRQML